MILASEGNVLDAGGVDACTLRRGVKWEVHVP
jgi:hypothetical protein